MKIAIEWLESLVELRPGDELAERLTSAGLECEVAEPADVPEGIVTGKIVACEPHPNADRLSVCTVDVGDGTDRTIVCGAPNAAAGHVGACALPGTDFGEGFVIAERKLRGVPSQGMLCSAQELGLSDDHSGLLYFAEDTPLGQPVEQVLSRPRVLVTEALSNRGDWMSVRGVAREVSAALNRTLRAPEPPAADASAGDWAVDIEDPKDCARYGGRVVEGLTVGPSPAWLATRLEAAGIRPISNLVDITNYVLLEYGQPLHAFDLSKLTGRTVGVRRARAGETLVTLDGKSRKLTPDVLLITDDSGPIATGGIMGGEGTAVTDATTGVFLEGASFSPTRTRLGSRALRLQTDASGRFERWVDPEGTAAALDRAVELLLELCPDARVTHSVDAYLAPPVPREVPLRRSVLARVLGVELPASEVTGIFDRLGLTVTGTDDAGWTVRPPSFRADLVAEEDLVEEVARIHGYDALPVRSGVRVDVRGQEPPRVRSQRVARRRLLDLGLTEVVTPSLIHAESEAKFAEGAGFFAAPVVLRNPLSSDRDGLRGSLIPSLAQVLATNRARADANLALFEVGRCFAGSAEDGVTERLRAGLLLAGRGLDSSRHMGGKSCDFFDMKGLVEVYVEEFWGAPYQQKEIHPAPVSSGLLAAGRAVTVCAGEEPVGVLGEAGPALREAFDLPEELPVILAELDLERSAALRASVTFEPLARFPAVNRDLAFVVAKSVSHDALSAAVRESAGELLTECRLFDVYEGKPLDEQEKSLAFMLEFRSPERSLKHEEVDRAIEAVVKHVESATGARIR